jgi:hypothetical protein
VARSITADLDGDGLVGIKDAVLLRNRLGTEQFAFTAGDVDGNGTVEIADLAALASDYGRQAAASGPSPGSAPAAAVVAGARRVDFGAGLEATPRRVARRAMPAASAVDAALADAASGNDTLRATAIRRSARGHRR